MGFSVGRGVRGAAGNVGREYRPGVGVTITGFVEAKKGSPSPAQQHLLTLPEQNRERILWENAHPAGFEPTAYRLGDRKSVRLC